jgi:hypothetical protein
MVLYPGGMNRIPQIKLTLNNGQDAKLMSVVSRHRKGMSLLGGTRPASLWVGLESSSADVHPVCAYSRVVMRFSPY